MAAILKLCPPNDRRYNTSKAMRKDWRAGMEFVPVGVFSDLPRITIHDVPVLARYGVTGIMLGWSKRQRYGREMNYVADCFPI